MRKLLFVVALFCTQLTCAQAAPIDSCAFYKRQNDTLNHKLYMSQKKIVKIKKYVGIVNKNPSQIKYLKGWINRTLAETK